MSSRGSPSLIITYNNQFEERTENCGQPLAGRGCLRRVYRLVSGAVSNTFITVSHSVGLFRPVGAGLDS